MGGISPAGLVAIGILVGLISDCTQAIGLTLQRKSHLLEDARCGTLSRSPTTLSHDAPPAPRAPYRRRRWQVGISLYLLANTVGSSVQLTTLPLPVLATLQASGLVFNAICATIILREPFTRYSFSGTLLILIGAVLIARFGAIPEPAHTLDQLLVLLGKPSFGIWMASQAIIVALVAIVATLLGRFQSIASRPRIRLARGICYGFLAGALSAHGLLLAKSAVELTIRMVVDRVNQFNNIPSWLILISFVAVTACQLYCLHLGLKLISTSILYPLAFCTYNIIAILDGLIYFQQTRLISTLSACLITMGVIILLSGVLLLSWRLEEHSPMATQNVLGPGMGMIEDTASPPLSMSDGKSENGLTSDAEDDDMDEVDITSPLLQHARHKRPFKFDSGVDRLRSEGTNAPYLFASPLTPHAFTAQPLFHGHAPSPKLSRPRRRSSLLQQMQHNARRRSTFEADTIYQELADDQAPPSPARSPAARRASSTYSSPFSPASPMSPFSSHRRQSRARSFGTLLPEEGRRGDDGVDARGGVATGNGGYMSLQDGRRGSDEHGGRRRRQRRRRDGQTSPLHNDLEDDDEDSASDDATSPGLQLQSPPGRRHSGPISTLRGWWRGDTGGGGGGGLGGALGGRRGSERYVVRNGYTGIPGEEV